MMVTKRKIDGYIVRQNLAKSQQSLRTIRQAVNRLSCEKPSAYMMASLLLRISTAAGEAQEALDEIRKIVEEAE